jgi:hypothetical protein
VLSAHATQTFTLSLCFVWFVSPPPRPGG